jgi:hypothetical protein
MQKRAKCYHYISLVVKYIVVKNVDCEDVNWTELTMTYFGRSDDEPSGYSKYS